MEPNDANVSLPHSSFRIPTSAFLSLDGPDGSGKTTQVGHLVAWLRQHGIEAVACRDPGGSLLGDRLRSILLDRHEIPIGLRAEMLLYMASRAQLVEEVIRPALEAGKVVVSDRFLLANVVYQGHAGGLAVEDVWQVGRVATGGLMPDLTIVLDVPPDVARSRTGGPRDRIEDRPEAFRAEVRRGFLRAVESYPAPVVVLDGTGPEDEVAGRIQHEVARVLGQHPRP
jgi:dTMP kinase